MLLSSNLELWLEAEDVVWLLNCASLQIVAAVASLIGKLREIERDCYPLLSLYLFDVNSQIKYRLEINQLL